MGYFETRSKIGPDGKLHLDVDLPSMANREVRVTVQTASGGPATNGAHAQPGANTPKTSEEWRAFVDRFAGSMPDFPDVVRPGPDSYEKRDLNW